MKHHHSSGKYRLLKRVIMMCLSLILVCSMSISAFAVNRIGRAENETTQSVQMTDNQKGEAAAIRQKYVRSTNKNENRKTRKNRILNRKQKTIQKNKRKIQKTQTTKEPKKIAQKKMRKRTPKRTFPRKRNPPKRKKHREKV